MTIIHACELSTDDPNYRIEDYCSGCNQVRAHRTVTEAEINAKHHAHGNNDSCTIIGCEVCP